MFYRRELLSFIFLFVVCAQSLQAAPERSKGVSIHMLPKRVADISGRRWGFVVDYASYLKSESEQPVFQTTSELLSFIRKQDADVQKNGVWIVMSHPDAYSEPEKALLNDTKELCRKGKIPLF